MNNIKIIDGILSGTKDEYYHAIEQIFKDKKQDSIFYIHETSSFALCYDILKNGLFISGKASDLDDLAMIERYGILASTTNFIESIDDILNYNYFNKIKKGCVVIIEQPSAEFNILRKVNENDNTSIVARRFEIQDYEIVVDSKYIKAIIDRENQVVITSPTTWYDEYFDNQKMRDLSDYSDWLIETVDIKYKDYTIMLLEGAIVVYNDGEIISEENAKVIVKNAYSEGYFKNLGHNQIEFVNNYISDNPKRVIK